MKYRSVSPCWTFENEFVWCRFGGWMPNLWTTFSLCLPNNLQIDDKWCFCQSCQTLIMQMKNLRQRKQKPMDLSVELWPSWITSNVLCNVQCWLLSIYGHIDKMRTSYVKREYGTWSIWWFCIFYASDCPNYKQRSVLAQRVFWWTRRICLTTLSKA